ncbi:MAG TPA: host attachment family protein [Paracoccus sp. (in: a-proteobacteria)]|uniref:host attachment family protein n=1 Tax=Paracoccus sp. TaxID=267 RepID=UPI002C837EED|nr:host attachment family protein [Paracoccus sp. (in: a-proteobacteria)]HWL58375.1 host attachment family protein [Paracoccus sp. (in: a-proteobacteria)]
MIDHALSNGTWFLIADGEKALFFVNEGDREYPVLKLRHEEAQDNPPDREQSANRPGRQQQSVGSARSAYEDTDWHQLAKDRFATHLAELLYRYAHDGDFAHIVLVAAPQVLAELRGQMHKEVSDRVAAEIPKTLTNHPLPEIERLLKAELGAA